MPIRRARPEEAPLLTALIWRSKAHWGYDAEHLARIRATMRITPEQIDAHPVYVLEDDHGQILGYYFLRPYETGIVLEDLFLEPQAIGKGHGKRLFTHALEQARARGYAEMTWESDAHAEGFYRAMGAERIGQRLSPIEDQLLPLMRFVLK
ncbi:MAG: GNAT family N-acetyltransferase [Chloroflexi bacterium]|nr:GNAT family N-acetyltransferase [Chloroflexota bacterium]